MYPVFHPNGRKKNINGKMYFQVEVIGNHGVCAAWLLKETIKQIENDGTIRWNIK
jgi:hypothetical protein